jgi:tripartite-type tricarboxylate transporter receptor subunit TctC
MAITIVFAIGLVSAALPAVAQPSQKFPARPVRIVVGFSAGSATDITARMIGPRLSELWGQPVIVENRPGAGSTVAAAQVAKAAPDGHTLLLVSSALAIGAALNPSLPYDTLKDFRGVAQVGVTTAILATSPAHGIKSVGELIALARAQPGKVFFGSAGAGSGTHLTAERFRMVAGIKTVHVAFKGQPEMLVEILAGRIHYATPSLGPALPLLKDGRLVALAVLDSQRSPLILDVPAITESLPTYERDASHALVAPAGTPRSILDQISGDVARAVAHPDVQRQMLAIGFVPATTTPEQYDQILRSMIETFTNVAKEAGLRPQ